MTTTHILACTLLLTACVADSSVSDESIDPGEGKADSAVTPTRTLTLSVDRRPVDGALIELHVETRTGGRSAVVIDRTSFDRVAGRYVRVRDTAIARGTCQVSLDALTCTSDPDLAAVTIDAVHNDGTWIATSTAGDDSAKELATGMRPQHLRFSRAGTAALVELVVDTGPQGALSASLRTTEYPREKLVVRSLLATGECKFDNAALTCVSDRRAVDGALEELRVEPNADGTYQATLRTAGQRLDGMAYDQTETLATSVELR